VAEIATLPTGEGIPPASPRRAALAREISERVSQTVGRFAAPSAVLFVGRLPKTRSGKIMRRVLRALLAGEPVGA